MQEPKTDGDEDVVWKVNDAINNPGGSSSGRSGQPGSSTPTQSEQVTTNKTIKAIRNTKMFTH